jgi:flagellar protein FliO/FliZ
MSAQLIIGVAIVAGLVGAIGWLIHRFGIQHLGTRIAARRQPHLAVVDVAEVDGRRHLILIRRDNTEHLTLLIHPK